LLALLAPFAKPHPVNAQVTPTPNVPFAWNGLTWFLWGGHTGDVVIDDSGNLHLKLTYANGLWYAASVRTVNPYTKNTNHWTHVIGPSITHTLTWQPNLLKFEVNRSTSGYASWQGTDTTLPYPPGTRRARCMHGSVLATTPTSRLPTRTPLRRCSVNSTAPPTDNARVTPTAPQPLA